MKFLKKFPFCVVIFLLIAGSCKKDFVVVNRRPAIDQEAILQLLSPSDSAYFTRDGQIELSASLIGSQTDYSFLDLYVIEAGSKDTLQKGTVDPDGSIHLSWQNMLAPGEYTISVVAVNKANRNEILTSDAKHIFICIPPPVSITGLAKDETSITISWEKTAIDNFKAYELMLVRTDTAPDLPPYPPGNVIAVISDINNTSYTDKEIYFYYKYAYVVRVVTEEDCGSVSERKTIAAGSFIDLPAHTQTANVIFDGTRSKMYALDNQSDDARLDIFDPEMLSIEHSIPIDGDIVFTGINENSSALNLVKRTNAYTFQLLSVDLNSFTVSNGEVFVLPVSAAAIEGVFDKKILYSSFTETIPREGLLSLYDVVSTQNEIIREVDTREATAIDNNNSKFVINAANDSFFVYSLEGGAIQLVAELYTASLAYSSAHAVFSSGGKIAVGGNLYDQDFNLLYALGNNAYFIGLSADGTYAATNNNEVYDISSSNVQLVKKYGDGFGTFPWFSNDNKTLYHLTEGSLNPKWNPGPRLFRYPFRD